MTGIDLRRGSPDAAAAGTPVEHPRMLLLRAATVGELAALLERPDIELIAPAAPSPPGPGPRIGMVDPTPKRLALARKIVARGRAWRGRNDIWFSPTPLLGEGKGGVAFLFPGLEAEFAPRIEDLAPPLGLPVPDLDTRTVGRHGAAVMAVGRIVDTALRRMAIEPDAVAGHSVGEWTAMIAGGIVDGRDFDEMLAGTDLDALRVPGVEFAVLGCTAERAAQEITGLPDVVISHENSTNQTVVCGPAEDIQALVDRMRADAVICQLLPFRSGFHTPMLEPFLGPLQAGSANVRMRAATIPVWSATTASPMPADPAAIRALCTRHLLEPVRFRSLVLAMHESGIRAFIQAGPGQLGSLVDDTLRERDHLTITANAAHSSGLEQLRRVATALWVDGATPDLTGLAPIPAPLHPRAPQPSPSPAPVERQAAPVEPPGLRHLRDVGARFPGFAELDALIAETAASVAAVLEAAARGRTAAQQQASPMPLDTTLEVSTSAMPYLLDHCFARQRDGWPDETDLRPVVPATTVVQHLMDAAQRSAPGRTAIGVDNVRLHKWLVAAPPETVTVRVRPLDDHRVAVSLGDYADAEVVLGERYEPPATGLWPAPPQERLPTITAEQVYAQRWLFHGPAFQGLRRLDAISGHGLRGRITVPEAPGGLLDNVGQLLGPWLLETHPDKWIAFPFHVRQVRFHEAPPPPGTTVDCAIRITAISDETVRADAQVSMAGRLVVSVSGWEDHRFDGDLKTSAVHRFPETSTLSDRHEAGWWMAAECWPTLASRDFYLRKYLGAAERADYERCPPPARRQWLLGRIAIKDAVRGWLWDQGYGPIFPAELQVGQDAAGRYTVTGRGTLSVPDVPIAAAQCRELAVASVGRHSTVALAELPTADADATAMTPPAWNTVTRATAGALVAKAVATANGGSAAADERTNHGGQDDGAADDELVVTATSDAGVVRQYRFHAELVNNPEGLPPRQYVVAWTAGTTDHHRKEDRQ